MPFDNLDDTHWLLIVVVIVLLYLWGYPKYLASNSKCYSKCEQDYASCSSGCASEGYTDAELRKQAGQEHYDDKRDDRSDPNLERHFSRGTIGNLAADVEPEDIDAIEAQKMRPAEVQEESFVGDNEARIIAAGLDKAVLESHDQYLSDNWKYMLSNASRHSTTSHREDAGVSWVGRPPAKGKHARTPGGPTMIFSNYEDQLSSDHGRQFSWY